MESTHRTHEQAKEVRHPIGPQLDKPRKGSAHEGNRLAQLIGRHPGKCLLFALAIGIGVGHLVSRR
jgi:hypothetical protein